MVGDPLNLYLGPRLAQTPAKHPLFTRMPTVSDAPSDEYMRRALLLHLERISKAESWTADPLTIACLRGQYNTVMERINQQRSRSSVDFITRLPPELSLYCLRESLPVGHYAGRLLDFTMVSTQWSEFILSAKEPWAYVDLRASQHDAIVTLATFLELSGRRLLHLTIWDDPGDEWDNFKPLLTIHQQRIHTISFRQENLISSSHRFSIACRVLQSFDSLNRSTEVYLGDQPSLSLRLPQLELLLQSSDQYVLQGLDFSLSVLPQSHKILRQIGSVTTGQTLGDVDSILPSMTNLKSIWLRPDTLSAPGSPETTSHSPAKRLKTPIHLTSLTCFQDFGPSLSSLISAAATTLSDLTVVISGPQWTRLLSCLRLAINLKELSIELRGAVLGDEDKEMTDLVSLSPILGVTVLSLQVQDRDKSPQKAASATTLFCTVVKAFAVLYPGIQSLKIEHCDLGLNHAALHDYIESLKSLEYLGIWEVVIGQSLEIAPILLPSLKRLDCDSVLVPYINAPTLESVRTAGEEGLMTERFSSLLAAHIWNVSRGFYKTLVYLSSEKFLSLQSITMDLPVSKRHWKMPSLPSLRKIRITSSNRLDQSATMLCISFLYNPHHCPVLEEIELNGFVEWDVLMLMLERRNFRRDGVKRISTLRIPLTPPRLEFHLESLLMGVYTERPSNEELSTATIVEVMCNAEIPGCIYCIKNMIPGCKQDLAASRHGRFFRLDRFYEGYPDPPSTLDYDCLAWVGGSTVRTEKWKAQWVKFGTRYRRRKACGRYSSLMTSPWSLV